jgi:hypothetical protein
MRWLALLSIWMALPLLGACKYGLAISGEGMCLQGALADVRIGLTYCSAGNPKTNGVELEHSKEASSKHFMGMIEETVPGMVDAGIKAYMASTGISALGSALKRVIPDAEVPPSDAIEEVLTPEP